MPAPTAQRVALWERFFNGNSAKEQLFARYAYEHLFLANLFFDDEAERRFFKLVRSTTPPGQALKIVASRRPVDDPGVERVYYRLAEERETIVAKTHMPYALNAARMARWRELFLDAPYVVERLPGYSADTAANPFRTFAAIPVQARYRFMLEEAAFTIMGFIKGPVCRGQIALDVIEDRFWVAFLAPSDQYDHAVATLLQQDSNLLRLPTGSSNTGVLIPWLHYARLENEFRLARTDFLAKQLRRPGARLDEHLIWDGDGRNDNAALTIFRHFDSASVVKGMVGGSPKTAWVIGYPLLERIHYLLVANYDVYGNVGHQLNSRLYMDIRRLQPGQRARDVAEALQQLRHERTRVRRRLLDAFDRFTRTENRLTVPEKFRGGVEVLNVGPSEAAIVAKRVRDCASAAKPEPLPDNAAFACDGNFLRQRDQLVEFARVRRVRRRLGAGEREHARGERDADQRRRHQPRQKPDAVHLANLGHVDALVSAIPRVRRRARHRQREFCFPRPSSTCAITTPPPAGIHCFPGASAN